MLEIDITHIVGDLSLRVKTNLASSGVTVIWGRSGAGKTSLLDVIAGLNRPQQGKIILDNRLLLDTAQKISLLPKDRRIGYVFQDARLFPHYTVNGNLCYGMTPPMEIKFNHIVDLLDIKSLLARYPVTLSGGEKQRVAIGRALLSSPDILLMDEPFAALDLPRKHELLPYLKRLANEVNIPILYVTHNLDEMVCLANDILVLDRGMVLAVGELEQVWASDILTPWLQKNNRENILNVYLDQHHSHYAMSGLLLGEQLIWVKQINAKIGQLLRIQIQATDISLALNPPTKSSIHNVLTARIISCDEIGHQVDIKLDINGHSLWVRVTSWARDELSLKKGLVVFALIKTVSVRY